MTRVETPQEAFISLQKGKIDYFMYSLYAGKKVINELSLTGIEESSVVSSQPFYIGISKKSPYAKYIKEINASLQKMIDENKIPKK
jgi:ABC-type amino acid transport substrate-binding protein